MAQSPVKASTKKNSKSPVLLWGAIVVAAVVVGFGALAIYSQITSNASSPEKNYNSAKTNVENIKKRLIAAKKTQTDAERVRSNYTLDVKHISTAKNAVTQTDNAVKAKQTIKNSLGQKLNSISGAKVAYDKTVASRQNKKVIRDNALSTANATRSQRDDAKTKLDKKIANRKAAKTAYDKKKTDANKKKLDAAKKDEANTQTILDTKKIAYNKALATYTNAQTSLNSAANAEAMAKRIYDLQKGNYELVNRTYTAALKDYNSAVSAQAKAKSTLVALQNYYNVAKKAADTQAALAKKQATAPQYKTLVTAKKALTVARKDVSAKKAAVNKAQDTYKKKKTAANKTKLDAAKQTQRKAENTLNTKTDAEVQAQRVFDITKSTWTEYKAYAVASAPIQQADTTVAQAKEQVKKLSSDLVKAKTQLKTTKAAYDKWNKEQDKKKKATTKTNSSGNTSTRHKCPSGQIGTFTSKVKGCFSTAISWSGTQAEKSCPTESSSHYHVTTKCLQKGKRYALSSSSTGISYRTMCRDKRITKTSGSTKTQVKYSAVRYCS